MMADAGANGADNQAGKPADISGGNHGPFLAD
jgi:hypothetical protein